MRNIFFLAIAVVLTSCVVSQTTMVVPYSPTSLEGLKVARPDLQSYEKRYSKDAAVFLLYERSIEYTGIAPSNSATSGMQTVKLRYIVLKPDEEWLSTFHLELTSSEDLTKADITVLSPDGVAKQFTKDNLVTERGNGNSLIFKLAYPNIVKGSIVEENYQVSTPYGSTSDRYQHLQFSVPCDTLRYVYSYPSWWEVQVKYMNPSVLPPYRVFESSEYRRKILMYSATNVEPLRSEPYSPFYNEVGNYMQVHANKRWKDERILSWEDYTKGYNYYVINNNSFWSRAMENAVEDVVKGIEDKRKQAEAIIRYVQQNIEVGESAYDDNFADVIKKKKGSRYMITAMTKAMLEQLHIPANYIVVHSASDGYFDKEYNPADQAYIPALNINLDNSWYFAIPYYRNLPMGLIPFALQGEDALQIEKSDSYSFTQLPKTLDSRDNLAEKNMALQINGEGVITVEETATLNGFVAYEMRNRLEHQNDKERLKTMKDLISYGEGETKLLEHEVQNENDPYKPLVIRLKYTIDNLVTVLPDEVVMQTAGILSSPSLYYSKLDTAERTNDISISAEETMKRHITIAYPSSWHLSATPKDVEIKNDFGSLSAQYKYTGNVLTVDQQRTLLRNKQPKKRYREFSDIYRGTERLGVPTLVFSVQN